MNGAPTATKSRARLAAERLFGELNSTEPAPPSPAANAPTLLPACVMVDAAELPQPAARNALRDAWGMRWIAPHGGLRYRCKLPPNWSISHTVGMANWSVLKDPSGAVRAEIFDRAHGEERAFIRLVPRYAIEFEYNDEAADEKVRAHVVDRSTRQVIARSRWSAVGDSAEQRQELAKVTAWLLERFPRHADALTYWPPATTLPKPIRGFP
jgi:hypothetical protein